MSALKVIDPGLYTSVQDAGRVGYRKYGVPTSGAMDMKAYDLANWLVGNEQGEAVLECTIKGGKYKFETNAIIATTGAQMQPRLNSVEVPMNQTVQVNKGDILELGFSKRGCRAYVAIRGKLDIKKVMGSYSTYGIGKFGGFEGRALNKNDSINWESPNDEPIIRKVPTEEIPYYSSKLTLTAQKGLEWDWLAVTTQEKFLNSEFKVSSQSNRMGIRLLGESLEKPNKEMLSSSVIPGIIQLPPNGLPIILAQDGQTIGGYPRIAKVADNELWRLGQLKPGDTVSFRVI